MAIDFLSFPIKKGDFPLIFVSLPEGIVRINIPDRLCRWYPHQYIHVAINPWRWITVVSHAYPRNIPWMSH